MGNKEEIAKELIGDTYVGSINIKDELIESFIKGLEYSDQQNKELLARVDELEKVIKKLDDWSYDCRLATYPKSEVQSVINKNK